MIFKSRFAKTILPFIISMIDIPIERYMWLEGK
jgi:hypothetical protein